MDSESWEQEELFFQGDSFFESMLSSIARATQSIRFETYIFEKDPLGKRVTEALARAAGRGVRVKLLLDGVGSNQWALSDIDQLTRSGVETRIYHPLPWQTRRRWLGLGYLTQFLQLNRRNHRKSCLIDGKTAYLGGMNVSAKHLAEFFGEDAWRDTGLKIQGPALRALQSAFEQVWKSSRLQAHGWKRRKKRQVRSKLLRLNSTPRARKRLYQDLIHRIVTAKTRVWITTPYLVPQFSLLRALRFVAWKGVDVRLLVPGRNDVWFMKLMGGAFYSVLQNMGVKIYEYSPAVLHSKSCLIDQWAITGSSNLNSRSLNLDLEVDVVLSHPASIEAMSEQFERDLLRSREVIPSRWRRRLWINRAIERLLLKLRRWA